MKYTLMTMDRNTIFLPRITGINDTFTLENQNSKQKISPNTENFGTKINIILYLTIYQV